MSPVGILHRWFCTCFPRASGDEPLADGVDPAAAAFSPRERG